MSKVLVAGYGSAGQYVVDFLLKDHRIEVPSCLSEIHIMSRKPFSEINPRLEISRVAAGISERYVPLLYHQADFDDHDRMVEVLQEVDPDVIVYTGRFASGLKYGAFSYPQGIGYGVWIPLSLVYITKLMKAVKASGIETKVINTSFPDGVNYYLNSLGLAPYCGAGNLNHLVPRIKRAAARRFMIPASSIDVDLVCSHYTNTYVSKEGTTRGSLFLLSVDSLYDSLLFGPLETPESEEFFSTCKDNSAGGQIRNQMIATDCAEITRYLIDPYADGVIHVPGFNGLPGGVRCRARRRTLELNTQWDLEDIVDVNTQGLKMDGVVIDRDVINFTDEVREKMERSYQIKYPEHLYPDEVENFAVKIRDTLSKY